MPLISRQMEHRWSFRLTATWGMTRSSKGTDGRLDAPFNGDCLSGLVIRHESATSTKKVVTRIEERGEGHVEDREGEAKGK